MNQKSDTDFRMFIEMLNRIRLVECRIDSYDPTLGIPFTEFEAEKARLVQDTFSIFQRLIKN